MWCCFGHQELDELLMTQARRQGNQGPLGPPGTVSMSRSDLMDFDENVFRVGFCRGAIEGLRLREPCARTSMESVRMYR